MTGMKMNDLSRLADLIERRNALEREIAVLIDRPAAIGHIGEFIAGQIFNITLEKSASFKSIDGRFLDGPLESRSVNIKWYAKWEGLLDITPEALPDFYLVLTGPKSRAFTSRGGVRPWAIDHVFLFDAKALAEALIKGGVKIRIATSVRSTLWENAEIYPRASNNAYVLSEIQQEALRLFGSGRVPD